MKKSFVLFAAFLLALVAGSAGAKTLSWHGTLDTDLGALPSLRFLGSGVATVNNSSGGTHLNTLRLAGVDFKTSMGADSGTIPVTDPETVGSIPSIRIQADLGTATLSGISGGAPINQPATLPLVGWARVCLLDNTCAVGMDLDFATPGGAGIGVGGLLTIGGAGKIRISIINTPWTIGKASGLQATHEGGFRTVSKTGFVHGAASANSTTATGSGVIQLITPQSITVTGTAGNSSALTLFATLTIHFIPEPGLLLLIGSGVVGLGLLGRARMKK